MRNLTMLSLFGLLILFPCCGTLGKSSDPTYLTRCPDIAPYTMAERNQVADELSALPPDAATRRFMADYGTLRQRCRRLTEDGL